VSDIGLKVKLLRGQRGWSQQFLADKAKMTRIRVCYIESGRLKTTADELYMFSKIFGVSMEFFFEEKDEKPSGWVFYNEGDKVAEGKMIVVRFRKMHPSLAFFSGMSKHFHQKDTYVALKVDEYMEIPE
jgi:transcriptional regulator with XRE-family HTH domain